MLKMTAWWKELKGQMLFETWMKCYLTLFHILLSKMLATGKSFTRAFQSVNTVNVI